MRDAIYKFVRHLNELDIAYVVVGALAMFQHGYRRITEQVDLLVTADGYRRICEHLEGRGYLSMFERCGHLYDTDLGVTIQFVLEGEFPGDNRAKPVAYPNPAKSGIEKNGVRYVNLPTLIELKLASAISNAACLRHFSDVLELIKALHLSREFREQLNPYVQAEYDRLWQDLQSEGPDVHEQGIR